MDEHSFTEAKQVSARDRLVSLSGKREVTTVDCGTAGTFRIHSLLESERSKIAAVEDIAEYRIRTLAESLIDDDGAKLFDADSEDDRAILSDLPMSLSMKLYAAVEKLNGLDETVEDTAKN